VGRRDDVERFGRRAASYDSGRLGRWHATVAQAAVGIALEAVPAPRAVLDVGCGTGVALSLLAARVEAHAALEGVDPAAEMIGAAHAALDGGRRVGLTVAAAEALPFDDDRFDLAVSTLSFDHWADQGGGLREVARVLAPGGRFVLVDLFARWLAITTLTRPRARTRARAESLLAAASLRSLTWHSVHPLGPVPLIQAVVAGGGPAAR
jgi:ubiquinone/menaquinone biosynthesis C-methylase UbiE